MPVPSLDAAQILKMDPIALNKLYHENRARFSDEELAAYAGQMIAWWPDGSRIFDADADYQALFKRVDAAGYPSGFFSFEPRPRAGQTEIDPYIALAMRFNENYDKFPTEELARYDGQTVAWWPDGSRIVDADFDSTALVQRLRAKGYDLSFLKLMEIECPYRGRANARASSLPPGSDTAGLATARVLAQRLFPPGDRSFRHRPPR
jgi:hypothetical protein